MRSKILFSLLYLLIIIFIFTPYHIFAHCDGIDGPVVKAAQKALETENVNLVLIWVKPEFEEEIKTSFNKTIIVRKQSPEAKEIADMYFFETLVRLHRLGEGAPYTGLKPAGRDLGPVIPLADKSIIDKSDIELSHLLIENVTKNLHQHFQNVIGKKVFNPEDVKAGREFIKAYVTFIHYVEGLYESSQMSVVGHYEESEDTEAHKH